MTVFDIIKDIVTTKNGSYITHPQFNEVFNRYFILKYLSCDIKFSLSIKEVAKYNATLSNENLYLYLIKVVPKGNSYIKYIKKQKDKNDTTTATATAD